MIILSGPSTIGKNPMIDRICIEYAFDFVVPWTTRRIRKEEINGRDYFFISKESFKEKILDDSFLDWDYCLGNYYGYIDFDLVSQKKITHGLSRMVIRLKRKFPQRITTVFLMPENKEKILNTLNRIYTGRDLFLRSSLVEEEIGHATLFDYTFTIRESVYELLDNKCFTSIINNDS